MRHEHPAWCHLEWCTVTPDGSGYHQTEPTMVAPENDAEPDIVMVSIKSSALSEVPVVYLETHHPKEVNAYCGLPDEPELTVLSLRQGRRLAAGLGKALNRPALT
jgi:hypothetical protein